MNKGIFSESEVLVIYGAQERQNNKDETLETIETATVLGSTGTTCEADLPPMPKLYSSLMTLTHILLIPMLISQQA